MAKECRHCHGHNNPGGHHHEHHHAHGEAGHVGFFKRYARELICGALLILCVLLQHFGMFSQLQGAGTTGVNWFALAAYVIAIMPVGIPVLNEMIESWREGSVMNEFTLMVAAAVGAFLIGEYPEAVAVLLFYSFGEKLEDSASDDVRRRIKSLLGRMPDTATVVENGVKRTVSPKNLPVGTRILVQPGERVPVDAKLSGETTVEFDTAAITGESVPRAFNPGDELPSGIIPVDRPIEAVTLRAFDDSSMTRILKMIEDAQAGKSHTETMLRRITRWYTPIVFGLALAIFFIPWIVLSIKGDPFAWQLWFRRSLVFLVCSCPCALVVSIPLSYFVSLGTASKIGLLFKGSTYLDSMRKIRNVVFDKTGTLTTGDFHVDSVGAADGYDKDTVIAYAASIDADSTHPLAKSICEYAADKHITVPLAADVKTVSHGIQGRIGAKHIVVGSGKLLKSLDITVPESDKAGSRICVAVEDKYIGSIYLLDTVKEEAKDTISQLHRLGIKVTILSGDRGPAVERVDREVGADSWRSELLPQDKQKIVDDMRKGGATAFVGDGVNDAPAIASADVGVAMGTMGTGMAMDTADVIISGDNLSMMVRAIRLSRRVERTIVENIAFALGVKAIVMILGAFGIATLWAAVFADTGVTLITILWTLLMLCRP